MIPRAWKEIREKRPPLEKEDKSYRLTIAWFLTMAGCLMVFRLTNPGARFFDIEASELSKARFYGVLLLIPDLGFAFWLFLSVYLRRPKSSWEANPFDDT